jgi:hypothetical protein
MFEKYAVKVQGSIFGYKVTNKINASVVGII